MSARPSSLSGSREESVLPLPVRASSGLPGALSSRCDLCPPRQQADVTPCPRARCLAESAHLLTHLYQWEAFWFVFPVFIAGLHHLSHERLKLVIPRRLLPGPGRGPWQLALPRAPWELSRPWEKRGPLLYSGCPREGAGGGSPSSLLLSVPLRAEPVAAPRSQG